MSDTLGRTIENTKESGKSEIIDLGLMVVSGYNPKKIKA